MCTTPVQERFLVQSSLPLLPLSNYLHPALTHGVCALCTFPLLREKRNQLPLPKKNSHIQQIHHFYGHKPGLTLKVRFVLKPEVGYLDSYFLVSCDVQSSHELCYIWGGILSYFTGQRLNVPSVPWYRGVILVYIYFKSQCSTERGKRRSKD